MKKQLRKTGTFALAALLFISGMHTNIHAEETIEETIEETYSGGDLKESDELLNEYLEREITPSGRKRSPRGSSLEGNNACVYSYLKEQIELTANGEIENTEFSVPLDAPFKASYTAAELGVDAIIVYDEELQKNVIAADAKAALGEKLYDLNSVINALIADIPYELYWYDKTTGSSGAYSMSASSAALTVTGLTIKMAVSYAYNPDGYIGTYTVDTSKTSAVPAAVNKAKEIRDEAAYMSDHEKLIYYREQICDLTSYNYDAVNNDEPYGDPWQIINVFDQDPSTNVVCEGYSKSFKYLCDLTTFDDSLVEALLMTGTMGGGTGAGRHMWDMVRMPDGRYYLVDVTNCDENTAGYPDKLFLAGTSDADASQFTVPVSGTRSISYTYDDDTLAMYSDAERMIAPESYGEASYFISIDEDEIVLYTGESAEISYTILPAGTDTALIEWSSSDASAASVENGIVSANSAGQCTITASIGNGSDSVSVIVLSVPQSITVETAEYVLKAGETAQIHASVLPADADQTLTYSSSDDSIASVDENGLITANSEGTAQIAVQTVNSITETVEVTVTASDYEYTVSDASVTITKYTGSGSDVVIPSEINGLPVASIGSDAFLSCESVLSVTIPDTVTDIGDDAFASCINLAHIIIPASVTTVGRDVFYRCAELKTAGPIGSGSDIEYGWTEEIPDNAFECAGLVSAVLPDTIVSIGKRAFDFCTALESITIPESLTGIGFAAFQDCENLAKVIIPADAVSFGEYVFSGCAKLKTAGPIGSGSDIEYGWTVIPASVFYSCGSLENVTIADSVTGIGRYAFYNCTSLSSIEIPASVTSIDTNAFGYANDGLIEGFEIYGYQGTAAEEYAVSNNITFVPLGITVEDFKYDNNGSYITITGYTGDDPAAVVPGEINGVPVLKIANNAFRESTVLQSIYISSGVQEIGNYAFMDCTYLTSVTMADSVINLGDKVFEGCTDLTDVTLSNSLAVIPSGTFSGCSSLENIAIPDGIETIGAYAFENCTALKTAMIPDSVTAVGNGAYFQCTDLASVSIPENTVLGTFVFDYCSSLKTAGPAGSGADYEFGWKTAVIDYAFQGCDGLVSIAIPDSVTSIGKRAFYSCESLADLTIPAGVTEIGEEAFGFCGRLKNIILPEGLTSIGKGVFKSCSSIKEIVIPEGVVSVGDDAFRYCNALADVTFPETLGIIGGYAFANCGRLKSITIPASVTAIGEKAFGYSSDTPVSGFTVYGYANTAAQRYAEENDFEFVKLIRTLPENCITDIASETYSGEEITPAVTVTVDGRILTADTDYKVSYNNNINAGTASVTIEGIGDYSGTVTKEFVISPKTLPSAVTLSETSYTYDGKAHKPDFTVQDGSKTLIEGTDYDIKSAPSGTNAGIYTITVELKGNYTGTPSASFTINKAPQTVTAKAAASVIYAGKATTITVTGNQGTVTYSSSDTSIATVTKAGKVTGKKAGTVTISAVSAATDNYKQKTAPLITIMVIDMPAATSKVAAANKAGGINVAWKKVSGAAGYKIYRNDKLAKTITDVNTVSWGDTKATTNGTKYVYKVVAYTDAGISDNSASVTIYRLDRPAISSLTNSAAGKMTVKWGKNAKATGYQVQYSTTSTFDSYKTVTITSNTTVSKTISSLTEGMTYYVRVRSYLKADSVNYYSMWSAVKTLYILNRPSISSLANSAAGKMTVKWAKNAKATGYQVQYSTSSTFDSYKTVTITSNTTVSKVIASLTKGKTYYVRIRSYKKLDSVNYYSMWSAVKSLKLTK